MCTAVARRIFFVSVPIRAHPWAEYLPSPVLLLPVVWQYSRLFSCASVGCLLLAAIPASIPHPSPLTYSLKKASNSAASYNLSSLAFYVHCPNYSGILLVFRAKSFPLGEDLGEATPPSFRKGLGVGYICCFLRFPFPCTYPISFGLKTKEETTMNQGTPKERPTTQKCFLLRLATSKKSLLR